MDREKVISEIVERIESTLAVDSEYVNVPLDLLQYALAMLKEQEAVKPKSKVRHGANAQIQHFCGNCNSMLHGKPKYCSECGKGVLW